MSLTSITAAEARRLLADGATLVDVREPDEYARERVPGALNVPVSRLADSELPVAGTILFHCKSGARTAGAAQQLAAKVGGQCDAFIVEGGLANLRKSGTQVTVDSGKPIELQRQVQIGAGALTLAGTLFGLGVSPWFFAVPAFVGAGLVFAGVTGFCGMARLLMRAPWNRLA
jgi:rhodanese-related sulfurtransferase